MKYSVIEAAPRMLRKEAAGQYVGGPKLLEKMQKAEPPWIQPSVAKHKMTLYDRRRLDECCDRLDRGEFPDQPTPETPGN
jgi:hypothetical protein